MRPFEEAASKTPQGPRRSLLISSYYTVLAQKSPTHPSQTCCPAAAFGVRKLLSAQTYKVQGTLSGRRAVDPCCGTRSMAMPSRRRRAAFPLTVRRMEPFEDAVVKQVG